MKFSRQTAIVGIGATEFSKNSGRTPMQLATECSLKACEDAGIEPSLINGISVFSAEKNTDCLLYTSPSPRDNRVSRMTSYA